MTSDVTPEPAPDRVVQWRRDLHAHPELGFTEFRTASRVAGELADLGWQIVHGSEAMAADQRLGLPHADDLDAAYTRAADEGADSRFLPAMRGGHTAVVASLSGRTAAATGTVVLRVDMDALPIHEDGGDHLPARAGFASRHDGVMHACGHDGHVAMGVELAHRLAADPPEHTVRLVFQPAEEGGRGGRAVAASGLLDDVDLFVAIHLGVGVPSGQVLAANDGLLANSKLRAVFHGRASHAALAPQDGRNALLGAATATLAVQGLTRVAAHETRVAVGAVHGGTSSNIVADRAEMLLETRADDGEINADLEARVRAMLDGAALMHGLTVGVELIGSVTTARADASAVAAIVRATPTAGLVVAESISGGAVASDDATALMRRVQAHGGAATYAVIGADLAGAHHTATFDFDERVLEAGVTLLESVARGPIVRPAV